MSQHIISLGWEVLVNAVEASLFLFLISSKLKKRHRNFGFYPLSFLFFTSATCLINYLQVPSTISLILLFVLYVIYSVLFFQNSLSEKLFWGSIYTFIELFADKLAFWTVSVFTSYHMSEFFFGGVARIPIAIIYLTICFLFVILLQKIKNQQFYFPKKIQILLILLMAISIIVSDSLLTLIIEVDTGHIPANLQRVLSRNNYLCLLLFFALLFMIKWVGSIYKKNLELLEENRQRRVEQQQFELFASTTQALREWKHDYKNNLSVVCLLLADDNTERARTYLEELLHTVPEHSFQVSSGNSVLDAIVSTKLSVAKKENIDFQYNIFIPEAMPLSAIDFSTIMGNLLDNALEACTHVEKSAKPYVSLTTKTYMDMFYIQIRNSSCGKYSYNSLGELLSVKEEQGHGIGVRRIRQVVEKYNGVFQQNPEADKFTITLMIPFVSSANKQAESDD